MSLLKSMVSDDVRIKSKSAQRRASPKLNADLPYFDTQTTQRDQDCGAARDAGEDDESVPQQRDTAPIPISSYSETQRQPLLFVDVNLGPSKSERIIVRDGDTSEGLANQFCLQHGIKDPTMR